MEKQLEALTGELTELVRNQLSDYTGREIIDSLNWIASELKRFNDREEGKK